MLLVIRDVLWNACYISPPYEGGLGGIPLTKGGKGGFPLRRGVGGIGTPIKELIKEP